MWKHSKIRTKEGITKTITQQELARQFSRQKALAVYAGPLPSTVQKLCVEKQFMRIKTFNWLTLPGRSTALREVRAGR